MCMCVQDFSALCEYLRRQQGVPFLNYMANFHLLLFLYTHEVAGLHLKVSISLHMTIT